MAVAALAAAVALAPALASAQEVAIDLGEGNGLTLRAVQLFVIVTLLSLAPALAVTITCFPFMVTVLSILRAAVGLQQSPPNMLIVSLALFLSWFVMAPVFEEAWAQGVEPLVDEEIAVEEAAERVIGPFREFMAARVDPAALSALAQAAPNGREEAAAAGAPGEAALSLLTPAFLLSEIQRAFEIGFLIYLPFLMIDLVVASVLMSMGMMMVPPAVVSLPFKLAFFVAADGWSLLAGALVRGYGA
ncbi:MAG: flagellar type III secretion system pore protein FliP [Pseudomonadota bacterium]